MALPHALPLVAPVGPSVRAYGVGALGVGTPCLPPVAMLRILPGANQWRLRRHWKTRFAGYIRASYVGSSL